MKRSILFFLFVSVMSASVFPVGVKAESVSSSRPAPVVLNEYTTLIARLDEINNLDVSKLGKAEKKELRAEVRSIKKVLRDGNGGIYLSVGALIVIILLLIILL